MLCVCIPGAVGRTAGPAICWRLRRQLSAEEGGVALVSTRSRSDQAAGILPARWITVPLCSCGWASLPRAAHGDFHGTAADGEGVHRAIDELAGHIKLKASGTMLYDVRYSHPKRWMARREEGMYILPDPRHIDKVLELLDMTGCKAKATPMGRKSAEAEYGEQQDLDLGDAVLFP